MENFSKEQLEQFLKIEKQIIGNADHVAISKKGIFDDLDGEGVTQMTTKTYQ
ncbi:hypothetical protein [Sphingobacterium athyrii]|uniref:hypothetical protein n=1 Tax=Sphingobacterium athyrii TaxID=2152717 RepID=UPI0015E86630|nr:hypothetical protein [Sphingobacterium athyrii]